MTWTKLSDDFSDDCWEMSDAAFRLHVDGLVWSNRKLLNCRISREGMDRWTRAAEALPELLTIGWWEEDGDELVIVHHAVYQRTREAVLAQQEANRKNGEKGGRPPGPPRERAPRKPRHKTESKSHSVLKTDSLTESESEIPSEMAGPGEGEGALPAHAREEADDDYQADLGQWCADDLAPGEREHLNEKADRLMWEAYDR